MTDTVRREISSMIKKRVVVVIPCYNEGEGLHYIIDALAEVRRELAKKYSLDILFVNDGSSDNTQEVIESAAVKNSFVYWRSFARNSGHQSALRAGIDASISYDAVVMMDSDMQHPPELIPQMVEKWEQGAKVVQMVREDSAREVGTFKYTTSMLYYRLINAVSDLNLEYGSSDFRLIDRTVAKTVAVSRESDLFLRGYFTWLPVQRVVLGYTPNKRAAGVSKYSLRKLFDLAYRGILQFSEKPLRIAVTIGTIFAVVSIVYGIALALLYFIGGAQVSGWTSLMVVMLFCFGVNFILLGIIGTYLAHSISIQKQRPEYIISNEKLNERG
ncbi:MAG: glycosyltransferase family 2 protein [Candidatus Saccharimonas sp.]